MEAFMVVPWPFSLEITGFLRASYYSCVYHAIGLLSFIFIYSPIPALQNRNTYWTYSVSGASVPPPHFGIPNIYRAFPQITILFTRLSCFLLCRLIPSPHSYPKFLPTLQNKFLRGCLIMLLA